MPILHFKGKSVIQNHHHTVKFHELEAVKGKSTSKAPSLDDNLIIHGDNLIALKALLPTYAGKVKCIYIDPPYNTGNEHWAYNDNVNSPMIQKWLGKEVARDDLTRHDKWCCMMYPRLTLLRELLRDDGVIFVSIDDNEVQHLRMMMDEIFGEANMLVVFIWKKKAGGGDDSEHAATEHEYVLCYGQDSQKSVLASIEHESEAMTAKYSREENGRRYYLERLDKTSLTYNSSMDFEIECPDGSKIKPPQKDPKNPKTIWRWGKDTVRERFEELIFEKDKKNGEWRVYTKTWESLDGVTARSLLVGKEHGRNRDGTQELTDIFATKIFPNPKPTKLLRHLLTIGGGDKNDALFLDSFAGSASTAHAILSLNADDKGKRKFILVECEDYADKITAERVRRVSKGVKGVKDEKLKKGLGGTFSFYELGDPIDIDKMLDGNKLPSYESLAHYAFFTATGESFDPKKVDKKLSYIGASSTYEVFLLYEPDGKKLRELALNLDFAEAIEKKFPKKPKLVFAPACFLEEFDLRERNIRFAQLPFEIYRLAE